MGFDFLNLLLAAIPPRQLKYHGAMYMHRFHDVRHVILNTGLLERDLEIDILAETVTSYAKQYGPRLDQRLWDRMIRNFSVVCERIGEQDMEEGLELKEKIGQCVEWFEQDLATTLGQPRKNARDRRNVEDRRNADRRHHTDKHYDGPDRRTTARRKHPDRRNREAQRRGGASLLI